MAASASPEAGRGLRPWPRVADGEDSAAKSFVAMQNVATSRINMRLFYEGGGRGRGGVRSEKFRGNKKCGNQPNQHAAFLGGRGEGGARLFLLEIYKLLRRKHLHICYLKLCANYVQITCNYVLILRKAKASE